MKYILIETALFTAQMKGHLKGYSRDSNGKYVQDNEGSLIPIKLKSDASPKKQYYCLKWSGERPSSVLPRYTESGDNYKVNKIMTFEELELLVLPDIDAT